MNNRIFNLFLTVFILLTFIGNSIAQNQEQKKDTLQIEKVKLLKSRLNLTDNQTKKIVENDSVMEQITLALKDSIIHTSVRKTIDSFVLGKYNTKETYLLIRLQLRYKNATIELANKNNKDSLVNMTIEEFERFHDKLDSLLSKEIIMKRDTVIYNKDQY